jgi:hypothetical protein
MINRVEFPVMDIDTTKELCLQKNLRWTNHIFVRLLQRGISMEDVECAILSGTIIEEYPDDHPYPSGLVVGVNVGGQPLHVVCSIGEAELWLITAYYPSIEKWTDDFTLRKESER